MKHAASVRPEPGSNSPLSESLCPSLIQANCIRCSTSFYLFVRLSSFVELTSIFVFSYSVVNVQVNIFIYSRFTSLRTKVTFSFAIYIMCRFSLIPLVENFRFPGVSFINQLSYTTSSSFFVNCFIS